jgi:hypothetical protein
MNMLDQILKYGPWIYLGVGLLFFAYLFARYGFRGATFGGRIRRTFGEVPLSRHHGYSGALRIHEIERKDGSHVGMEIVQKSLLSYETTPITFSCSDAAALAMMLNEAVDALGMGSAPDATGSP